VEYYEKPPPSISLSIPSQPPHDD